MPQLVFDVVGCNPPYGEEVDVEVYHIHSEFVPDDEK